MENSTMKCPVCGKDGIPDFYNGIVKCPCCDTDLSVYHHINELAQCQQKKTPVVKYLVVGLSCLSFVLALLLVYQVKIAVSEHAVVSSKTTEINQLNHDVSVLSDSILILNEQLSAKTQLISAPLFNMYVVRHGDSFCKISKKLYGTEARYKEIVNLNHLTENTCIHEGDTLQIPNK
jgi:LysM repeat protein